MQDTSKQYDDVIDTCKSLFIKKMSDYGSAWRILKVTITYRSNFYKSTTH